MKQTKKELFGEVLRFLVIGGIATLGDYAIFYLFNLVILKEINLNINLISSTVAGFITGLFINWFFQSFVYRYLQKEQINSKKVFLKFVVLSVVGLIITEVGILLGKPLYGTLNLTIIGITFDFWKLFMKCLLTGIVLVINYLGRKLLVFRITETQ